MFSSWQGTLLRTNWEANAGYPGISKAGSLRWLLGTAPAGRGCAVGSGCLETDRSSLGGRMPPGAPDSEDQYQEADDLSGEQWAIC